jgi:hypothetical protein
MGEPEKVTLREPSVDSAPSRRRERRFVALWLLTLAVLSAIVGGKVWNRRQFAAAQRSFADAFFERQASWRAQVAPLAAQFTAIPYSTPREMALAPFKGYGIKRMPAKVYNPSYDEYRFRDPKTDTLFVLVFRDGRFVFSHYSSPPSPAFDPRPWERVGVVIRWVGNVSAGACVLVLLLLTNAWAHRRAIGQVLLAMALVTALAGAQQVAPDGSFRIDGRAFSSQFSVLMAVIAMLAIFLPRRRPINGKSCRACGYNLTGNVSGRCPECGTYARLNPATSEEFASRIAAAAPAEDQRPRGAVR